MVNKDFRHFFSYILKTDFSILRYSLFTLNSPAGYNKMAWIFVYFSDETAAGV